MRYLPLVVLGLSSAVVVAYDNNVSDHVADMVVGILSQHYRRNSSSTMITRIALEGHATYRLQSDIIEAVTRRTSGRLSFVYQSGSVRPWRPFYYNLALVDGYRAFEQFWSILDSNVFNFSGYYVVVLTSFKPPQETVLERIFKLLWERNIVNVIVVAMAYGIEQELLLFTYFPYQENECGHTTPTLMLRGYRGQSLDATAELFPNKLQNFNRCPVFVGSFHHPPFTRIVRGAWVARRAPLSGLEGEVLQMIATQLNFTIALVEPDIDELWGSAVVGNFTGSIALVMSGRVNLTLGGFIIRGDRNDIMKHSQPYCTITIVVAVPPGRPYTPFEKLFRPFTFSTWLWIMVISVSAGSFILLLKLQRPSVREFVYGRGTESAMMNLLNVVFGGALARPPRTTFARTILGLWIYHTLVVRSLYQGSMFEYLQQQKNFSHLASIKQLLDENYEFHALTDFADYVNDIPSVGKRTFWMPNYPMYTERLLIELAQFKRKAAVFTSLERIAYYNSKHFRSGVVHITNDALLQLPIGFYYPKKSCFTDAFDLVMGKLWNAGYFTHFRRMFVSRQYFRRNNKEMQEVGSLLTNDHLMGCYEIFTVLMLIATAVFLLELLSLRVRWLRQLINFLNI